MPTLSSCSPHFCCCYSAMHLYNVRSTEHIQTHQKGPLPWPCCWYDVHLLNFPKPMSDQIMPLFESPLLSGNPLPWPSAPSTPPPTVQNYCTSPKGPSLFTPLCFCTCRPLCLETSSPSVMRQGLLLLFLQLSCSTPWPPPHVYKIWHPRKVCWMEPTPWVRH